MPDLLPSKQYTTEVTALPSSTSYAVLADPVVAIQVGFYKPLRYHIWCALICGGCTADGRGTQK